MKRLFSKKSGFTLVEIIIAFAIFAIMASMIMQILHLTIMRQQSNRTFEEGLNTQEELLIAKEKNLVYDETQATDGTLSLKFKDKDGKEMPMDINYQLRAADGTNGDRAGINYFVGNMVYDDQNGEITYIPDEDTGNPSDPADIGGGSQMSRFDTCITGTRGLNYVEIKNVQKLSDTEYKISVCADSSTVQQDNLDYAQFTLFMGRSTDNLQIENLIVNDKAGLSIRKSGLNGVRIGVTQQGTHLSTGRVAVFTVKFDHAPAAEITKDSFGSNSSNGKYSKYQSNTPNIYGAFEKTPTT